MGRFVPGFGGLKRGIDLIMFGKQSILPWANFYSSGAFGKVKWWGGVDWRRVLGDD